MFYINVALKIFFCDLYRYLIFSAYGQWYVYAKMWHVPEGLVLWYRWASEVVLCPRSISSQLVDPETGFRSASEFNVVCEAWTCGTVGHGQDHGFGKSGDEGFETWSTSGLCSFRCTGESGMFKYAIQEGACFYFCFWRFFLFCRLNYQISAKHSPQKSINKNQPKKIPGSLSSRLSSRSLVSYGGAC